MLFDMKVRIFASKTIAGVRENLGGSGRVYVFTMNENGKNEPSGTTQMLEANPADGPQDF